MMKIHFSKKEYRLLLDILYIADWVMHSHEVSSEKSHPKHDDLRKKLLSHYKEMDAGDLIAFSQEDNAYYESRDYENGVMEKFLSPYNEEVFWEELVDRLADRDLLNATGIENYLAMDSLERGRELSERVEQYETEFEENGIARIKVVADKPVH